MKTRQAFGAEHGLHPSQQGKGPGDFGNPLPGAQGEHSQGAHRPEIVGEEPRAHPGC